MIHTFHCKDWLSDLRHCNQVYSVASKVTNFYNYGIPGELLATESLILDD